MLETDSQINSRLIHLIANPDDTDNRMKLELLKNQLNGIRTSTLSQRPSSQRESKSKLKPRNLGTKRVISGMPANDETKYDSDSSVEILTHSPSQRPNTRNESNRSNRSNRSNHSNFTHRSTHSNTPNGLGLSQTVKRAVPPNHCQIPQSFGANGDQQLLSGMNGSRSVTPGYGTESEMTPGIETIEVSDCDLDHLSAERDVNAPVPKWCNTKEKINRMSWKNQLVNPAVHFGDVINVHMDLRKVMGKYHGRYKKKPVSSWKDDMVTEEENIQYLKFQGWVKCL